MAPVYSNGLGNGNQIPCDMVEIIPTVTLLCGLLAPCIGARDLGSYQNTPFKKFMIIMDNLPDEHTTGYI